jgi:hypothetical protein
MVRTIVTGAILACLWLMSAAAQEAVTAEQMDQIAQASVEAAPASPNAYGYTFDDVAVNQGIVLYWYAHACKMCSGSFPETWAAMVEKGALRTFTSPQTGEAIDPDDGNLDFDGDMTYKTAECGDVTIEVKTSKGVVTLPGVVMAESDISVQWGPCCQQCLWPSCIDISICGDPCWGMCCKEESLCKAIDWMMWRSFETHQTLFGSRPADELAWYASGLAPVDKNWKELAPYMDIEFVYKGDCTCKILKKAYVHCCASCNKCETKCNSCNKCESKCNSCEKPKCDTCNTCSKCKQNTCTKCNKCETKCNSCEKPKCETCKPKCESCNKCEKKCGTCDKCKQNTCTKCEKPKCESCNKCAKKCDTCKPKCNTCK